MSYANEYTDIQLIHLRVQMAHCSIVEVVVVVTGFPSTLFHFMPPRHSWHKCEEMGSQDKIMSALCHGMRRPIVAVMSWSTSKANYIEL